MSLVSIQSDLFLFVLTFNIGGKVPETEEQTINFYTNTNCTKKYPQKLELKFTLFQVICWLQKRRAKFKRDMEELKKDVEKESEENIYRELFSLDLTNGQAWSPISRNFVELLQVLLVVVTIGIAMIMREYLEYDMAL